MKPYKFLSRKHDIEKNCSIDKRYRVQKDIFTNLISLTLVDIAKVR